MEPAKIMMPEDFIVENKERKVNIKRLRGDNWSEEDKELLKDLVKKRVKEVENKNTDTNTNNKKKKAWLDIEKDSNSFSCKNRSAAQLKSQWSTIKIKAKKEVAEFRMKAKQTGGGPAATEAALSGNDLAIWLPNEFMVDTNQYDSDALADEICFAALDTDDETNTLNETTKSQVEHEINGYTTYTKKGKADEICSAALDSDDETNMLNETTIKKQLEQKSNGSTPYKKKVKKLYAEKKVSAADENILKIATSDVECRNELHMLQVEAEKKRIRNLDLEFEFIQARLNFYRKNSLDNIQI